MVFDSIDGTYSPFDGYPGYASMAPCFRSCNHSVDYNGCDNSGCWCKKANLDLRMSGMGRCASTGCTFANMNTATDASTLSGIQVQYCVDRGHSPEGMTLPSTTEATTTSSSPSATGTTATTGSSRTRTTSGPTATNTNDSQTPTSSKSSSLSPTPSQFNGDSGGGSSSSLSSGAKTGIGIGVTFCALLAILIVVLLLRRRKSQPQPFAPPPPGGMQPPPMVPTPYSGNGPYAPPPLQQPAPIGIPQQNNAFGLAGTKGDVSPIEEKAPALATVARKEVGANSTKKEISPHSSPPPQATSPVPTSLSNAPTEVPGSVPPPRHEFGNDGEIAHTVSIPGTELDAAHQAPVNQYPGYQESRQGQWGYQYPGQGPAYEVDAGHSQWQNRQELPGPQGQGYAPQGQQPYPQHGQHGGTFELGPGR